MCSVGALCHNSNDSEVQYKLFKDKTSERESVQSTVLIFCLYLFSYGKKSSLEEGVD